MSFMENEDPTAKATEQIETMLRAEASRPRFARPNLFPLSQQEEAKLAVVEEPPSTEQPKVDHTLLPLDALDEVSLTLMVGRDKHSAWNWVTNPLPYTHLLAKAQRHIFAFQRGENIDPGTGRSHIACAICDLLFLQSHLIQGVAEDDRFKR